MKKICKEKIHFEEKKLFLNLETNVPLKLFSSMSITLDTIDKKILNILQEDGKITTKALADQLGMTTTPIFERIRRMEKHGIIDKYVCLLQPKKIDRKLIVFASISIKNHGAIHVGDFIREMNKTPEVMEVYHIGGNYDFLIKVVTQDMETYQKFVLHKLSNIPNIDHVQSSFVLSNDKYTTAFKL